MPGNSYILREYDFCFYIKGKFSFFGLWGENMLNSDFKGRKCSGCG